MTTYSTYHECKSKNPNDVILKSQVRVSVYKAKSGKECRSKWKTCDHDEEVVAAMINKTEFAGCEINKTKPRTKTEFVKCEFNHAWEAVRHIENGKSFFVKKTDGLNPLWVEIEHLLGAVADWKFAHSQLETEIDERQEFIDTYNELRREFKLQHKVESFHNFLYDSGKFKLVE